MKRTILLLMILGAAASSASTVYNIHLHTDSTPDWTDRESFLASTMPVWDDPQDQGIALWRWLVRSHRQTHATREDGRYLWDPFHFYSSYANTYCGFMAAFMTTLVDGMGGDWRHRYVELGDHTVMEMSWDAGATWHMFDTSMVIYALNHDGSVASCADIAASMSCEVSEDLGAPGPEPGHLYYYHGALPAVTNPPDPDHAGELTHPSGYRAACDNPIPYDRTLRNGADSYISGFSPQENYTHVRHGWTHRLHLRPGQSYTRHWTRQGSGPDYYRPTTGGEDPDDAAWIAGFHGNGLWTFAPDLSTTAYRDGVFDERNVVHASEAGGEGPAIRVDGGGEGVVVWKQDSADVTTSSALEFSGSCPAGDAVLLSVSRDAGATWDTVWSAPGGDFSETLAFPSAQVGGAHEVLYRIELHENGSAPACGLDSFRIETVTQVNAFTLPRFQTGANAVRFRLGPQHETLTLWPPLHGGQYDDSAWDWDNVFALPSSDAIYKCVMMPATAGEAHVTWRLEAPTDILRAEYGGSFLARRSGPGESVSLHHAWDDGPFEQDAWYGPGSTSWWDDRVYAEPVPPAGTRAARLRVAMESGIGSDYTSTGVNDVLLQLHHSPRTPGSAPVAVTWCWTEHRPDGDVTREHTRIVSGDDEAWIVNVAGFRDPTMEWVRIRPAGPADIEGYSDGDDVGPGDGRDKIAVSFAWNDDVARGRSYTVSRPSAGTNPDTDGVELTDGVIIPPTTWTGASRVQGQTAHWAGDEPLTVTIDLESASPVAAVRVTTHQPVAEFAHAGTIEVRGSTDGATWESLGVIQHDDVWAPPGDDLAWGFEQSPEFVDLPAGGVLSHGFWLLPATAVQVRWLELRFVPLEGYGLSVSEIQAFSDVTVTDWPDREVVVPDTTTGTEGGGESGGDTPPRPRTLLRVWPNPANPLVNVAYETARPGPVTLEILDLRGRVVRRLADGWRASGAHTAVWDGRDGTGRPAPSGTYLARLADGMRDTSARVVLVR